MYIRFVLDPFIPHGIDKVIRRVIKDLRHILKDVTYSTEFDETLGHLSRRDKVPVSKIFQKKLPMTCRGIAVYIVNTNLTWYGNDIYGISTPTKCIVGVRDIPKNNYKIWAAKIWDIVLHELGHSFGLIKKYRVSSYLSVFRTSHCLNNCSMADDRIDFIWSKKVSGRFDRGIPYCGDCLKYLLAKDV